VRKTMIAIAFISALACLAAQPGPGMGMSKGLGIDPQKILDAAPGAADKTPDQLTLGERLALASAVSISMQEQSYVRHAAMASFMVPGAGQFQVGNYGLGAIHLGAEAAIIGGSAVALWYLAPPGLLDFSMTMEQRHAAMGAYLTKDRIGEILPAMGVVAGGALLSFINRAIAADGARKGAQANLASGKVKFEASLSMVGGMPGLGMSWKFR
jgi:hypothetical protein